MQHIDWFGLGQFSEKLNNKFSLTDKTFSHLVLYMWKESCKQEGKDQFNELLSIFSLKQQEEDRGQADAKVR